MATESGDSGVPLDSLPYIDKEYDDPATRERVLALIQDEMGRLAAPPAPKNPTIFKNSALLRKEYERVRAGQAPPPFDAERYKLEAPSGAAAASVDAWKQAADNAASQLEHQGMRLENLELLQNFGANAWKLSNYQKECLLRSIEAATQRHRDAGAHVNKARKYEQTEAGVKLHDLESRWSDGVRQCLEVQMASSQLRLEIEELERQLAARGPGA
ncbi:hypothetical protein IWQ56_001036 [Coemansia nantahalensis]|nr:hypothetical protein IWQ56_001036 [Coemansia nantahalensis]